ncbi:ABC transporter ATP-binding protein [Acidimangrovimonas sediminis]|uniref:ABC transporter ATP-binding protein n=1 Tax=Acidimangrovimonas sediminis TaxID=2056283 RepID=UPI000C7F9E26|nr:ABC transporter ATP-binding protein [Acidimangrovimonas sediminis]
MTADDALLRIDGLRVFHGKFEALPGVDMQVGAGEVVSIIGANGAGKSSLLKAIVGQVDRIEGEIAFGGSSLAGRATPAIVAGGIALVPEGRRLFPSLSVEENLSMGAEVGRKGEIGLDEVFGMFPILRERRRQRARELSGGQQQMIAVGRALMANPRLLLCDEISLGLAPTIVNDIYRILPQVRDRGIGIVVVEQDIGRSLKVADRFYCMLEGKFSLTGRPEETDRATVMKHYFGL